MIFAIASALEADGRNLLRTLATKEILETALIDKDSLRKKASADFGPVAQLIPSELIDFLEFSEIASAIRIAGIIENRKNSAVAFCTIHGRSSWQQEPNLPCSPTA